ncbi:MAG: GlcNAc-PI de-N-acetylase [Shewanella sp. CG18_big_fil_WC_8_21_14_2_50_42_11]|uniref:PIG-L deacetylase family protein n=1 Tax=Shewanella sp. CG18_big_fil_WC_8_21_14_2_50_42_11 TaxID=1975538 RepID=UPI000C5FD54F|nr:PIG-L family deacetylase [Shewanella sp. CG18_big_fil_WC_8_21_14_2_50_42_11]PIP98570.1 MAG: GlcNAc-PI de-N-acetylase [Shewanella sp. CG18_big_fil_WC_8_21_14_2_50_42_11]
MKEKVLAIALHPDDETLGCGGTLLKHKANGDEIHWMICTEIKEEEGFSAQRVASRNEEIDKAAELYGFDGVHRLGLSTMKVDEYSVSELVSRVSLVINKVKPTILFLPFKSDVHSDHRVMFEAVYSCTKSFRYPFIRKIYMMETLSETEFALSTKEDSFVPNVFVEISEFLQKKLDIMRVFESEIAEHPFPRSLRNIEALATIRGATAGCEYAESFMLLKEIQK